MMLRRNIFLGLLLTVSCQLLAVSCIAPLDAGKSIPSACFMRTFGGTFQEDAAGIAQTADGGYLVLGTTASFGAGSNDFYLVKLDPNGNQVWDSTYGGPFDDIASAIQPTSDGNYILAGTTMKGHPVPWLIKVGPDGGRLWSKTFESAWPKSVEITSVLQLRDGSFLLTGKAMTDSGFRYFALRSDAAGSQMWANIYGSRPNEVFYSATQQPDGGLILTGSRDTIVSGATQTFITIMELGLDGTNPVFHGTLDNTPGEAHGIDLFGSGYVIYGATGETDANTGDASIPFLLNSNFQFSTSAGTAFQRRKSIFYSGKKTTDGGVIAVGATNAIGNGGNDVLLVKANASGSNEWVRTYGGPDDDIGISVSQTSDGGYVVVGHTKSFGTTPSRTQDDLLVIKVDSQGNLCN